MKYFYNAEFDELVAYDNESGTVRLYEIVDQATAEEEPEPEAEPEPKKKKRGPKAKRTYQHRAEGTTKKEQVIELYRDGKTAKEIADEIGISLASVYTVISKARAAGELDEPAKPKKPDDEDEDLYNVTPDKLEAKKEMIHEYGKGFVNKVIDMYKDGEDEEFIAEKTSLKIGYVHEIIDKCI